uniref:Uncharacterized protein n=1 Tax=Hyaloperonospora arabidopsidis (strain Emoy2) TaxID=559515 RepID=M4BFB2_HYAAE
MKHRYVLLFRRKPRAQSCGFSASSDDSDSTFISRSRRGRRTRVRFRQSGFSILVWPCRSRPFMSSTCQIGPAQSFASGREPTSQRAWHHAASRDLLGGVAA